MTDNRLTEDLELDYQENPKYKSRLKKINPMVKLFGLDPYNRRCKHCVHLQGHKQSASWFKCNLRRKSSSVATDHYANWEACLKFEELK